MTEKESVCCYWTTTLRSQSALISGRTTLKSVPIKLYLYQRVTILVSTQFSVCFVVLFQLFAVNSFEPLTFTRCEPHWDGTHYSFTLHWTIPQFVAYGAGEVFSGFLVEAEERLTKRFIDNTNVPSTQNKTSYSYTWRNLSPLDSQKHYEFEVKTLYLCLTLYSLSLSL